MITRDPAEAQTLLEAKKALKSIQSYPVDTLVREKELGQLSSFKDVIEPAQSLIDLFKKIPVESLDDLPSAILTNSFVGPIAQVQSYFSQILDFNPTQGQGARDSLITQIAAYYNSVFTGLYPIIAYTSAKAIDLGSLEANARGVLERVQKYASDMESSLQTQLNEANKVVEAVRKIAAEQGVTQQAIYFKDEANLHNSEAEKWIKYTLYWAIGLGAWAFLSLFLAKWSWLRPQDMYQHFQLMVSKALVFAMISFMLYLSAKTYIAHRHNEVVNRHRQNALLTFDAFVKASGDPEAGRVILGQAAACVFAPQATGYSQEAGIDAAKASSVIEVLGRPMTGSKG